MTFDLATALEALPTDERARWSELERLFRGALEPLGHARALRLLVEIDGARAAALALDANPDHLGHLLLRSMDEVSNDVRGAFVDAIRTRLDRWTGDADLGVRDVVVYADTLSGACRGDLVAFHRLLTGFAEIAERRGGDASIKRFAAKAPFSDARVEIPCDLSEPEIVLLRKLAPIFEVRNWVELDATHAALAGSVLRDGEQLPRVAFQVLRAMLRMDPAKAHAEIVARLADHPAEVGSLSRLPFRNAPAVHVAMAEAMASLLEAWDGVAREPSRLYPHPGESLLLWNLNAFRVTALGGALAQRLEAALVKAVKQARGDKKFAKRAAELLDEVRVPRA